MPMPRTQLNAEQETVEEAARRIQEGDMEEDDMEKMFEEASGHGDEAYYRDAKGKSKGKVARQEPGFASAVSGKAPKPKAKKAAKAGPKAQAQAQAVPELPALTIAALGDGEAEETASASRKGSTASKKAVELDEEMQLVAQKHLSTETGSSVKALEGLIASEFLCDLRNRHGVSAKLRGATRHHLDSRVESSL